MHRTHAKPRALLIAGLLAALLLGGLAQSSRAQDRSGAIIVPINGTVRLQMSTKKPIRTVTNPKEQAVNIRTVLGDPTTILITGQQPDVTRIELVDEDGKKETYEVIVQLDIEYLRTQLRRAVPTANITPIPTSSNAVILTGNVVKAEDVNVVMSVASSIRGVQIINALKVGGVQQVQLDVVVAIVSRSEFRRMAFNFFVSSQNFFLASVQGGAAVPPSPIGVGSAVLNTNGIVQGFPGTPGGAPTNVLFGVLHNGWGLLGFLQALRDENVLKLMAEPRLVTLSGRPASFLSGGEQAIPVPAGLGQIGVQFEEFGTRLNFLPIVLGNGKIHLEVEPEISNLDPAAGTAIGGTIVPGRNTNRVNTTVELETGQTFVIGGLIQHSVTANTIKVPVLGDLPFLGTAFSNKSYQEIEQEVVILVTPHLVDPQDCNQAVKILPGQETRTPDDFELFLEGTLEVPRGPRQVWQGHHYVAPYKNGPSADLYPCAGKNGYGNGAACGDCGPGGVRPAGTAYPTVAAPAGTPLPAATTMPIGVASPAPALPPAPLRAEEAATTVPGGSVVPLPGAETGSRPTTLPSNLLAPGDAVQP